MMEAIEDVQIRVTPTKMLSATNLLAVPTDVGNATTTNATWKTEKKSKDLLVSAVCLQLQIGRAPGRERG